MWWIPIVVIVLAILATLLFAPAKLELEASSTTLLVYIKFLFLKISLYPRKEKKKRKKKKTKKAASDNSNSKKEKKKTEKRDILGLLQEVMDILRVLAEGLRKAVRIDLYRLRIQVGSDEAAKTALLYSGVCNLYEELRFFLKEKFKFYQKPDAVSIVPDFVSETTQADIKIAVGVNLIQLIGVAIPTLLKYSTSKNLKG